MIGNKRSYFRISPIFINVELEGKQIELIDISIGGARFKTNNNKELINSPLVIDLLDGMVLEIPFRVIKQEGMTYRVLFFNIKSSDESALERYILNWQQKRALLSTK